MTSASTARHHPALSVGMLLQVSMSILVLSFSDVARDPRVAKISRALAEIAPVTVVGYAAAGFLPGIEMRGIVKPAITLAHKAAIAARQLPANVMPASAAWTYGLDADVRDMRDAVGDLGPDIVYANDLATLPLAAEIKARTGARLIYDSHEYAVGEGADRWLWRLVFSAYRRALESRFIHDADAVVTVSEGIAAALQCLHGLAQKPGVIRNIPPYTAFALRPSGERVNVLYHGLFLADRGLEMLIDSVAFWNPDRHLILRGFGQPAYEAQLKARAARIAPDRIHFPGPVNVGDMVATASQADIGVMAFHPAGFQQRYALPNKLFEYIMAGLAVVSTPCENIADVIRQYDVGAVSKDAGAEAFADALNSLSGARLDSCKQAALTAAGDLNWENERNKVFALVRSLPAKS